MSFTITELFQSLMLSKGVIGIVIYGPARNVQGRLYDGGTSRNRCSHISGLVVKAAARLRALMKYALLLLIKLSAFAALDNVRVWRSRSDRSCHQFTYTPSIAG
jgi:hypothetical protein